MRMIRDERGSSLIEIALAFPVELFAVLMVLTLGLAVFGSLAAENAARHGVRMGAVAQVNPERVAIIETYNALTTAFPRGDCVVIPVAPGGAPGSLLRIDVECYMPDFTGGLGVLFGGSGGAGRIPVRGSATMRQEGW